MKNKIYNFIKKNSIIIFFFSLIIIAIINFQYMVKNSNKNDIYYEREDRVIGTNAVYLPFQTYIKTITQEFVAKEDNLSEIDIFVNNVEDKKSSYITANMTIGLKDEVGNIICEYDYPVLHFYKSKTFTFPIPTIKDSKGRKYTLYINRIDEKLSNVVFIMDSSMNTNEELLLGELTVNDDKLEGNLYMTPIYKSNKNTLMTSIITIILSILVLGVIVLLNKNKKISIEKIYFIVALIVGIATVLLTPLFYGKDEKSHWARAYEISSGEILSGLKDGRPVSTFSKSIFDIETDRNFVDSLNNTKIKYNNKEKIDIDMQYMSVYSPVSYLPHSIGITISKIFSNNPAVWAYSARLMNALTAITLLYFAIKLIPFGKKIIFTIGLLPTMINGFSTLSIDGFLVATTILMISYILHIIYDKERKMNKKDYIVLALLSSIISLSKLVYLPFLFLLLLLISKKDPKKNKIAIIGIIVTGILLNILWGNIAFEYLSAGQGLNSKYYILETLKHPFQFIQKFIYTWYINIGKYINDLFGGNNAWFGSIIEDATIIPIAYISVMLTLSIFDQESKIKLNKYSIFIILGIILCTIVLISTSLYISCTPVGFPYFVGIQGRYFLPLLLPIGILLNNINCIKKININTNFILSLIIFISFINIMSLMFMYL